MNQKAYIGKKIRELRDAKNWSSAKLGNMLSKPKTDRGVLSWESGRTTPDADTLIELCIIFGVDISDFYYKSPEYLDAASSTETEESFWVDVPLYGSVAAGIPIEMIEDYEMKEVPRKFFDDDPDCFLVRAKGNSETGRGIFDGDYVLISPKYNDPSLYPNELFLTTVNGDEATIKQVHILENGIELIPDSFDPTYRRQIYDFNEIDTPPVTTLGMVTWHCAPF